MGLNTGLDATAGFGAAAGAAEALPAEYFEPDASATFWTIPSGVRSRSDRAVTWTWYPYKMSVYAPKIVKYTHTCSIFETAARWLVK